MPLKCHKVSEVSICKILQIALGCVFMFQCADDRSYGHQPSRVFLVLFAQRPLAIKVTTLLSLHEVGVSIPRSAKSDAVSPTGITAVKFLRSCVVRR